MEFIDREDEIIKVARELGMGGCALARLLETVAAQIKGARNDGIKDAQTAQAAPSVTLTSAP